MKKTIKTKDYFKLAELFKVLSNPKRIQILDNIKDKELPVLEIAKKLKVAKANASQHLSILRYLGAVTARRDGKQIFYKINPSARKLIEIITQ